MDTSSREQQQTKVFPPSGGPTQSKKRFGLRRWYPLLPLVPGLLFLLAFSVYPLVYALRVSLFDLNLMEVGEQRFVGLQNFASILSSQGFWHPLTVTVKFVVGATILQLLLGLGLAMLFYRRFPTDRFMRALLILPMVIAPVVVALLWRYMVNPDYGLINYFIKLLGFGPVDFFGSYQLALPSLVIVDTWQWTPFMFLIILAGLQGIPQEVEEAAKVDGAGPIQTFFFCLLPLLRYPIGIALLLRVIDAFRVYDLVFMTTRGGPINATDTMSWHIYNVGFRSFDISYAAAYGWLLLIVVLAVCTLIVRLMFRKEDLS